MSEDVGGHLPQLPCAGGGAGDVIVGTCCICLMWDLGLGPCIEWSGALYVVVWALYRVVWGLV